MNRPCKAKAPVFQTKKIKPAMADLLQNKNAVIYGGGGAVGGAVAKAFAAEGAKVFLVGRTSSRLEVVLNQIVENRGLAETAQLDALDKNAVEQHLAGIVAKAGSIDISFNAISMGDVHGSSLAAMKREQFVLPVANAMAGHFCTATAAVRYMMKKGSGVVVAITANAGYKPYPDVGGFGVACAAIEAFYRQLAFEAGRYGIRTVCLRSAGSLDAPGVDEVFNLHAQNAGLSRKQFEDEFAERTMLKRLPRLAEVANAAVIMASGYASAITGAIANVTCGEIAD
jgi:3-oxoacyl-[acyl-carrier protein] reductase